MITLVKSSPLRLLILRLGLLLALAPFLALTAFNQPFFDDFRNAYWMRAHGVGGVQTWLYQTWTGRYTSTFFMTVLNPVAYGWMGGVKLMAALLFVAQWASIAGLLRVLARTALRGTCSWSTAGWTAGLLLALFCNAAPAPFSFLYWFCGAVAYQIPLLGLLNFTTLALQAGWGPPRGQWRCAGLACVPLVLALAGNELTLVQAVPVLAILSITLPPAARPKWGLWLTVGGLAAAGAVIAPGNWVRAIAMAPPDPLHTYRWLVLGPRTAYSMLLFLGRPTILLSLLAAGIVGLGLGLSQRSRAGGELPVPCSRRRWQIIALAFGVLNSVGFLLFRYLTVGPPLLRALNEILLVLLISVAALAWAGAAYWPDLAGWEMRGRRYAGWLLLPLAGLFSAGHVPQAWRELWTSAAPFDTQMRARFASLRAAHRAGTPTVVLPPLDLAYGHILIPLRRFGSDIEFDLDLTPGCEGNINGVMERYFEVPDVCCRPGAPLAIPAK